MKYTCPLCNATFIRYKWFVKQVNRYSEEDRKKIFVKNDKIYFQGQLFNYLKDKDENENS